MEYQLLYRENQKEAFLPHEGFPHNNLTIPPCLVFWWVSIPWARSILGTVHGAKVIISRSVMKLFKQKDELWGNFTTWIFVDWSRPFLLRRCMVRTGYFTLNAATLVLKDTNETWLPGISVTSNLSWPACCRCPTLDLSAGRSPRSSTRIYLCYLSDHQGVAFASSPQRSAWMTFGWVLFRLHFEPLNPILERFNFEMTGQGCRFTLHHTRRGRVLSNPQSLWGRCQG